MSDAYRAGIIGLGFIGGGDQVSGDRIGQRVALLDGHHRGVLSNHPRVQLVAGCDLDEGRRDRFAAATSANVYSDWKEMLERERLDIVSVATYTPLHAELTLGCVEWGARVVYCEKPFATRLEDADRMLAGCEQAGALLVINHQRRFNPNFRRLRELIAAGELGELVGVSLQWASGRLGCVGTHLIDAARMLTSRDVLAVSGTLDETMVPDCRGPEFRDPGGWGLLRFERELVAVVNAPGRSAAAAEIRIEGTLGTAVTGGDAVELTCRDGRQESWPSLRQEKTSMDRALEEIVAWLDEGLPFEYPASAAVGTQEAIAGFYASHARNGAWVGLPLAGADRRLEVLSG